ncbi:MAG: fibrinogen-like YCDxxxxGGGW domain-containing protein [Byssovorax sp.]
MNPSTNSDVCTGGVCAGVAGCVAAYATLDPAKTSGHLGLSNGNLTLTAISSFVWGETIANIGKSQGKWLESTDERREQRHRAWHGITDAFNGGNVEPGKTSSGWTFNNIAQKVCRGGVALTQGVKVATSVCSWHRGIVDTPCMQSTGFFITDHTVSGIPWVVSDGTGDHGASSLGQNAGANYTMWVRADVTVNDGSSAANAGTSCGSIHQTYPALGNGTYWLDFDGAGPTVPAQYYCDMTSGGFTYNTADAAAINQGYYEIAYNDQGSCIPSCPNNVVKVYPVGAGQAMNCNPYVWTAADLSCMVDRYSTSASSPATISIGTGGDGVCVNKGDLCPLVLKSHYFRYRCY